MQRVDFNSKLVPTTIIGLVHVSFPSILIFRKFFNDICTFGSVGRFQCKLTALTGTLIDHHITLAR